MNEEMIDMFQAMDDIPKQIQEISKKINYKTITADQLRDIVFAMAEVRDTFENVFDAQQSNKRS